MSNLKTNDLKSFIYLENGEVQKSNFSTLEVSKTLCSGTYNLEYISHPVYDVKITKLNNTEESKIFNFDNREVLDKYFNSFFNIESKKAIENLGFNHKYGILLEGPPGNGKTSVLKYYYTEAVKNYNAIVFIYKRSSISSCWEFIKSIREIQNNPIVLLLDEFDTLIKDNVGEFKKMMDGEDSISNCLFLAATNYINQIPDEFKNRKSRFRYVHTINKITNAETIFNIVYPLLENILSKDTIEKYSQELIGSSLDDMKQFAIDKIMEIEDSNLSNKKTIGFGRLVTN